MSCETGLIRTEQQPPPATQSSRPLIQVLLDPVAEPDEERTNQNENKPAETTVVTDTTTTVPILQSSSLPMSPTQSSTGSFDTVQHLSNEREEDVMLHQRNGPGSRSAPTKSPGTTTLPSSSSSSSSFTILNQELVQLVIQLRQSKHSSSVPRHKTKYHQNHTAVWIEHFCQQHLRDPENWSMVWEIVLDALVVSVPALTQASSSRSSSGTQPTREQRTRSTRKQRSTTSTMDTQDCYRSLGLALLDYHATGLFPLFQQCLAEAAAAATQTTLFREKNNDDAPLEPSNIQRAKCRLLAAMSILEEWIDSVASWPTKVRMMDPNGNDEQTSSHPPFFGEVLLQQVVVPVSKTLLRSSSGGKRTVLLQKASHLVVRIVAQVCDVAANGHDVARNESAVRNEQSPLSWFLWKSSIAPTLRQVWQINLEWIQQEQNVSLRNEQESSLREKEKANISSPANNISCVRRYCRKTVMKDWLRLLDEFTERKAVSKMESSNDGDGEVERNMIREWCAAVRGSDALEGAQHHLGSLQQTMLGSSDMDWNVEKVVSALVMLKNGSDETVHMNRQRCALRGILAWLGNGRKHLCAFTEPMLVQALSSCSQILMNIEDEPSAVLLAALM